MSVKLPFKLIYFFCLFLWMATQLNAQIFVPSDTLNKPRVMTVAAAASLGYAASVVGLSQLWYNDYPQSGFHFFNDNSSWLQMDKLGHSLTTYQLGLHGYETLRWSGLDVKKSTWIGGGFGLLFMTSVEIMDGYSAEWGFSAGDMLANFGGTALFIAQQAGWNEQRMALKFSYSKSEFAQYRPDLLGSGGLESALKDYNGQTIWLSVNPSSFSRSKTKFLPWLNVAMGYGADGMLGGDSNPSENENSKTLPEFNRSRQFYLSLDVDLGRIQTRSHFLKTIFSVVGFIKVPAPTLEIAQGDLRWHWFYF